MTMQNFIFAIAINLLQFQFRFNYASSFQIDTRQFNIPTPKTGNDYVRTKSSSVSSTTILPPSSGSVVQRSNVKNYNTRQVNILYLSDWSDFQALDDYDEDDDDVETLERPKIPDGVGVENGVIFADENDSQEYKAEIGSFVDGPSVDWIGDPIFVPQGSVLPLTEENVQGVLAACREEIGTMFGYSAENRGVGITGGVEFVDLDGPTIILTLHGRFWHQRTTVLDRVAAYLMGRIPEIIDVIVEDEWELTDEANNEAI